MQPGIAFAGEDIKSLETVFNGQRLNYSDSTIIKDGQTFLYLRTLSKINGFSHSKENPLHITHKNGTSIIINPADLSVKKNGIEVILPEGSLYFESNHINYESLLLRKDAAETLFPVTIISNEDADVSRVIGYSNLLSSTISDAEKFINKQMNQFLFGDSFEFYKSTNPNVHVAWLMDSVMVKSKIH